MELLLVPTGNQPLLFFTEVIFKEIICLQLYPSSCLIPFSNISNLCRLTDII